MEALLDSLHGAWSATVRIPGDDQEMAVSFSSGKAAVMLTAGEDEFYDLVGDATVGGWTPFVHGGQLAEHPSRHCVARPDAEVRVVDFLRSGACSLPDPRWERQGKYQVV